MFMLARIASCQEQCVRLNKGLAAPRAKTTIENHAEREVITNCAKLGHWYNESSKIGARFDSKNLEEVESFVAKATTIAKEVLGSGEVRRLQDRLQTSGVVMLHNVPLERRLALNPIADSSSSRFPKFTQISEASLVGVGQLFGELLGYSMETTYSHPLVHDGFPLKGVTAAAVSSPRPQKYHQDMSYLDNAEVPDFVALLCLREGPVATKTGLIDNREIMQRISAVSATILRDPNAYCLKQPAWVDSEMWQQRVVGNWSGAMLKKSIVSGPYSWPSIALRANMDEVFPLHASAAEALKELLMAVDAAEKDSPGVLLKKGDIVLFNNKKMLHRRLDSKVHFDGYDRFIQRAYFHVNIASLHRVGRIHQMAGRAAKHDFQHVKSIRNIEYLELSSDERDVLYSSCPQAVVPGLGIGNATDFVMQSRRLMQEKAPKKLIALLREWKSCPNRFSAICIDNMIIEAGLVETPIDGKRNVERHSSCSELIVTGIAAMLGDPFSFAAEKPWLVNDLTPVRGMEDAATNAGSKAQLPWHTEHAATGLALNLSEVLVSDIVLSVLRPSPNKDGDTLIADVHDAIVLLSPSDKSILQKPCFFLQPPPSMRSSLNLGRSFKIGPRPILFNEDSEFQAIGGLYLEGVEPITSRASIALDNLRSALDHVQQRIPSRQGRVMLLNNRVTFHARAPFVPAYDGSDR